MSRPATHRCRPPSLDALQAIIDAPQETVTVKDRSVPTVASGLVEAERAVLQSRGLLDAAGRITPWVLPEDSVADARERC